MKKITTLVLACLVCTTLFSGCGGAASSSNSAAPAANASAGEAGSAPGEKVDKVQIGFLNPLSGANGDAGQQDLYACQLAVKHINEAGGIKSLGGVPVELVVADTTSDSTQSAQIAERTISSNKLSGIVGTGISGLTMPILPITEKYGVPLVTNSINDDITDQGYEYVFEPVPKGSTFGGQQVAFIKYLQEQGIPANKVAIIYENSSYGQSTAKGSLTIAENAGLEVVMNESFPPNFSDASSLVTGLKNSGAEIVMPVAYSQDAKLIVNTMEAMNYDPIIIGGGAGFLWPVLGTEMGEKVNGLISVASWNWDSKNISENPTLLKVTEDFEKEYGYFMTEHAGPSYTATWMIKEAIEKAASADSVAVRDAMATMDFDATHHNLMQPGTTHWDDGGWNENVQAVMIQWQDGKPRTIFPRDFSVVDIVLPEKK